MRESRFCALTRIGAMTRSRKKAESSWSVDVGDEGGPGRIRAAETSLFRSAYRIAEVG
jgi:hypothetical protein